jgi:alpha-L-fucosidase
MSGVALGVLLAAIGVLHDPVFENIEGEFLPSWESLDTRPVPAWFEDAKFGILVTWGVASVPAWAPQGVYAEWYWSDMNKRNSATWHFHREQYGETYPYQAFADEWKAELFEPVTMASLFRQAGAKYVILTSKHHDGFCLWPSDKSANWNSVDIGPRRDIVAELSDAVRGQGLKMGLYYSLFEWNHPLYKTDVQRYVREHMLPQFMDLIERYQPSIVWADGEWDQPASTWLSREFLAWLYNVSSAPDDVVTNDRWGNDTRSRHGDFFTTEYGKYGRNTQESVGHVWEECRGIGASFGYNRNERIADYLSAEQLIQLLVNTVSEGGNLLLSVGPTADGRIPVIMEERLVEMGKWLERYGTAIYGTRAWAEGKNTDTVRFTAKGDTVYAFTYGWPAKELLVPKPKPRPKPVPENAPPPPEPAPGETVEPVKPIILQPKAKQVMVMGGTTPLEVLEDNFQWRVQVPQVPASGMPMGPVYVFQVDIEFVEPPVEMPVEETEQKR